MFESWFTPKTQIDQQIQGIQNELKGQTFLYNHFKNIAEFASLNDINAFDNFHPQEGQPTRRQESEQYISGLLMNLELLARKWNLINKEKYRYRHGMANMRGSVGIIPRDFESVSSVFHINTLKTAFRRIYMKTFDEKEILIEKEFALAGAKLIQQFQILLHFI